MQAYARPWSKADLFFLMDSLDHGMPIAVVAGFLCRTVDEVREAGHWPHQQSRMRSSALERATVALLRQDPRSRPA